MTIIMRNPRVNNKFCLDLFIDMGNPFSKLSQNKGEYFELENSYESKEFIDELVKRNIVSNLKEYKNKFSVYIKKR